MLPRPNSKDDACISTPVSYFRELGNLHDSRITEVHWKPDEGMVDLVIDDLYANFLGLPEYVQAQPARLVMTDVSRLQVDVSSPDFTPRIMDFEVMQLDGSAKLNITVASDPFGSIKIECTTIACHPS